MKNKTSSLASSRRQFLRRGTGASAAVLGFPQIVPSSVLGLQGAVAPSNRIAIGIIGTGNQGTNDMRPILGRFASASPSSLRRKQKRRGLLEWKNRRTRPSAGNCRSALCGKIRLRSLSGMRQLSRFSGLAGSSGHRCSGNRHSRPLARHSNHPGRQSRQRRLLPKTPLADNRRRPGNERRNKTSQTSVPNGKPATFGQTLPTRLRISAKRANRKTPRSRVRIARRTPGHRQKRRPQGAGARSCRI